MNRRNALYFLAAVATNSVSVTTNSAAQDASDDRNVKWVMHVLEQIENIKLGMTRADLLKVFTTEGGLSTGLHRTYVSRSCPYFKVDVTFRAVGRPSRDTEGRPTMDEDSRDEISSISRPYLAFSVFD